MSHPLRPIPTELEVVPWIDPVVESVGFDPRSPYVETCWLPILGPTATWLYRRLGSWVNESATVVDTTDLAVSLGLGEGLGRNSMLAKGVGRLAVFGAAEWRGDTYAVRRALAPLPESMATRLSESGYHAHKQLVRAKEAV
jgi:hypothetical protein